jgi:hypothetical protein
VRVRQAEFGFLTGFIGAVFSPTLIAVVVLVALALFVLALGITVVVNMPTSRLFDTHSPASGH